MSLHEGRRWNFDRYLQIQTTGKKPVTKIARFKISREKSPRRGKNFKSDLTYAVAIPGNSYSIKKEHFYIQTFDMVVGSYS